MWRTAAGIGKSIAKRLAQQGLSVVLVALPNSDLDATFEELSTEYPRVEFRKVDVGLARTESKQCTGASPCPNMH